MMNNDDGGDTSRGDCDVAMTSEGRRCSSGGGDNSWISPQDRLQTDMSRDRDVIDQVCGGEEEEEDEEGEDGGFGGVEIVDDCSAFLNSLDKGHTSCDGAKYYSSNHNHSNDHTHNNHSHNHNHSNDHNHSNNIDNDNDSDNDSTISISTINKDTTNTVLDRGYAWIIVLAVFILQFLLIGYLKSGGVFFVEFQRKFNSNASMTSLVIGLADVFFSISAPLVMGPIVKRFSVRQICLVGSLLFTAGVVGNSVCSRIEYLILTHSLGYGLTKALLLGPVFVIINDYFLKRRALATAIATTGASFGGVAFPFLARMFYDGYGFLGGTLLTGGVALHAFIAAVLLCPAPPRSFKTDDDVTVHDYDDDDDDGMRRSDSTTHFMTDSGSILQDNSEYDLNMQIMKCDNSTARTSNSNVQKRLVVNDLMCSTSQDSLPQGVFGVDKNLCTFEIQQISELETRPNGHRPTICNHSENQIRDTKQIQPSSGSLLSSTPSKPRSHSICSKDARLPPPYHSLRPTHHRHSANHKANSTDILKPQATPNPNLNCKSLQDPNRISRHLSGSSMFHSTSTLADIVTIDKNRTQDTDPETHDRKHTSPIRKLLSEICGHPVMRSASFWVLIPFFFAGQVGSGLPQIFFIPLAKERGLTDDQASLCLSIQSAIDILAHVIPGLILNTGATRSTTISVLPMALMGVMGHLTPFFHSFESLILLSVVYGMCIGFFFTLLSLFVIDTLGVDNFALTMGYYFLTIGVAGATSFPIAGYLKDLTGTYSTTFHYLASMQLLAALILLVLPLVRRYDVSRGLLPPQ